MVMLREKDCSVR